MVGNTPRSSSGGVAHVARVAILLVIGLLGTVGPAHAQSVPLIRPYIPFHTLLARTDVRCIYQDPTGFVWMCTDEGLIRFDGHDEVLFGKGVKGLRAIVRRSDGHYWAGGASGLYELKANPSTGGNADLVRRTGAPFSSVNGLTEFADLSLGCATDNGVWVLKQGTLTELDVGLPAERARRNVRVLFESQHRSAWAGTSEGLFLRRFDATMHLTTADGLPDNEVQAVARGPESRLWVGTRRGVVAIDVFAMLNHKPGVLRTFDNVEALRGADVRALSQSTNGIFVGTTKGVVLLDRPLTKTAAEVRGQEVTPSVRALSARDGDVLLATDRDVRFVPVGPAAGETVITAVTIDGRAQAIPVNGLKQKRFEVPWRSELVEIRFLRPRRELRQSLMAGRSIGPQDPYVIRTGNVGGASAAFSDVPPEWTRTVDNDDGKISGSLFVPLTEHFRRSFLSNPPRTAIAPVVVRESLQKGPATSYASPHVVTADVNGWLRLPPEAQRRVVIEKPADTLGAGVHRLVIYGGLRQGRGDSASVDLAVQAAPWVRWWFIGPIAMAVAGTFIGYRYQRRRRAAEMNDMRSRIAADLHDSVGASLSRIAILSDVLNQQVRERMPETAPSLEAIGENARSAIDDMNDAVWLIDHDIRNIGQLLVRVRTVAAQLFDPDVSWVVEAPDSLLECPLTSEQRRHLYLLIKEALANAHRHARPSSVAVRFSMTGSGLRVEIEDDGSANEPLPAREGNGMVNMRARALALGGSVSLGNRTPSPGTSVVIQTAIR